MVVECCLLVVVRWALFGVRCGLLSAVGCELFGGCSSLFVGGLVLCVARCVLMFGVVVSCPLVVICCGFVVCCLLVRVDLMLAARCLQLFVVFVFACCCCRCCCSLFVVRCCLLLMLLFVV